MASSTNNLVSSTPTTATSTTTTSSSGYQMLPSSVAAAAPFLTDLNTAFQIMEQSYVDQMNFEIEANSNAAKRAANSAKRQARKEGKAAFWNAIGTMSDGATSIASASFFAAKDSREQGKMADQIKNAKEWQDYANNRQPKMSVRENNDDLNSNVQDNMENRVKELMQKQTTQDDPSGQRTSPFGKEMTQEDKDVLSYAANIKQNKENLDNEQSQSQQLDKIKQNIDEYIAEKQKGLATYSSRNMMREQIVSGLGKVISSSFQVAASQVTVSKGNAARKQILEQNAMERASTVLNQYLQRFNSVLSAWLAVPQTMAAIASAGIMAS